MSRTGKLPVAIPAGVSVAVEERMVRVKGPKGELAHPILTGTRVAVEGNEAKVSSDRQRRNPAFGTMRAKISNMVTGVTAGFSKTLEIIGTGYRASMDGKNLVLQVGYSHPVVFAAPVGITIKTEGNTKVVVSGADKALVGQVAADIRSVRPPEPYKGKGIKYEGEYIRRKAGKAAGAAT
ncbi:MAG: 50S ribosomal protein L6 [Candidatus Eisenbacteria bacterium]|uniref:Large ribosomal subunit protein uL6 n=1 Tax=Eiseniibacteriota bacterium TaxID=2212470 RepID=A0A538U0S9_UNCEI|nr:MAG: 50S ribosomal protein L6 [Candidatus Eisenbacteria bacterium]